MSPVLAAAAATGAVLGYKGNMASAKAARQVGEYNAKVAENEQVLIQRATREKEQNLRKQSERLVGTQRVATAKSGIQMSGSALEALRDSFFNTELDALGVRYAGSVAEASKEAEAAMSRATANVQSMQYKTAAYKSLLESGAKAYSYGQG